MDPTRPDPSRASAPPRLLIGAWRDLREVLGIAFPVIVAMASHTLMTFVDTRMLAGYGKNELAAVGAAGAVAFTIIAFMFGTAGCTSTFVSQSMGRGMPQECSRYTWQGMHFGIYAQAAVIPVMLTSTWIFAAFGHEPQLQRLESIYFEIRLAHVAGTAAYAALSSFFQGIGRPIVPMYAALVANLFNVLVNYAFIFGKFGAPELGIGGAALGTLISSYLQSGLLLLAFLWKPTHEEFRTRSHPHLDLGRLRRLLRIGVPSGLNFMLDVASWAVFTNIIIGRLGRDILAANNVCHSIIGLSFMPAVGMNKGVTVLVGQYIGRKNIRAAKRRAYLGIGLAMCYMVFMGLVFVIFRKPIIRFFRTEETIVQAGATMLILAAIFQAFDALGIVSIGALRGAGDTHFPAVVGVASSWGILLPLGYVLTFPMGWGYVGAWTAAAVHIAIIGSVLFWRFSSEAWRKIDIFHGHSPDKPGESEAE